MDGIPHSTLRRLLLHQPENSRLGNISDLLYTDPSGHGVDCGIGMGCVSPYTPPSGSGEPIDEPEDQTDVTDVLNMFQPPTELPSPLHIPVPQNNSFPPGEFLDPVRPD